jgi:hypothetical protein
VNIRYGPKASDTLQKTVQLFNHLVGTGDQRKRRDEVECFGCRKIDQIELGRLLDWQISTLPALS